MSLKERRAPAVDRGNPEVMHAEFMEFLDKEKAKSMYPLSEDDPIAEYPTVFKQVWHKADLEPNAQAHYVEMMEMVKACKKHSRKEFDCAPIILSLRLIDELDVATEYTQGVHKAIAKIAPFFYSPFLESEEGAPFKNSLMFNQAERAKNFPDIRSHVSNKYRSPDFFKSFEDEMRRVNDELNDLPPEWDLAIRPIIAHRKCIKSMAVEASNKFQYTSAVSFA